MRCFEKNETIVSQLGDNVFNCVHLEKDTLSIHCDNHDVLNITEEVYYGSLKIITQCACVIKHKDVTIARSRCPRCEVKEATTVDILLPAQWTTLDDYLVFVDGQLPEKISFQHGEEIFNPKAMDETIVNEEHLPLLTPQVSYVSVGWNTLHSSSCLHIV